LVIYICSTNFNQVCTKQKNLSVMSSNYSCNSNRALHATINAHAKYIELRVEDNYWEIGAIQLN